MSAESPILGALPYLPSSPIILWSSPPAIMAGPSEGNKGADKVATLKSSDLRCETHPFKRVRLSGYGFFSILAAILSTSQDRNC